MWMSTKNVVQQGASPNDANSPWDNLWSGVDSIPSVMAEYFPLPVGERGGVAGKGVIRGAKGGQRPALRPGPRR